MQKQVLRTILGDIPTENLGLILPHEHLFTDLRGPEVEGYAQADPKQVLSVMLPLLQEAQDVGVSALVECSTIGVGRNIVMLRTLAQNTSLHILAPTGLYQEACIPAAFREQTVEELADLFIKELTKGIGESGSKAGFIKIAISDDGPHPIEQRNIRAAARASQATGAVIASHTIGGRGAIKEISILQDEGATLEKFIWVHAGSESDMSYHFRAADLGVYLEFDSVGNPESDQDTADAVINLIKSGHGDRILLSHDAGWYQPGRPGGEPEHGLRGFTALTEAFIPQLISCEVDDAMINLMTEKNPLSAFAIIV